MKFEATPRNALVGYLIDQGLSPQQAYVSYGRMEGKQLPTIAAELGIAHNTAIHHQQKAKTILRNVTIPTCNDCIHCTYCDDFMFIPIQSAAVCVNMEASP